MRKMAYFLCVQFKTSSTCGLYSLTTYLFVYNSYKSDLIVDSCSIIRQFGTFIDKTFFVFTINYCMYYKVYVSRTAQFVVSHLNRHKLKEF